MSCTEALSRREGRGGAEGGREGGREEGREGGRKGERGRGTKASYCTIQIDVKKNMYEI